MHGRNPSDHPAKALRLAGLKLAVAAKTIRQMQWFEVVEQRGRIAEGKVEEFQVTLKIGFKLER